jgi:Tol biopolymer transport system component
MSRTRVVLASAVAAAIVSVAMIVLVRAFADDRLPRGRGDLIAYGCREPNNAWYAVCVMGVDGGEPHRITSRLSTTDPAWSPDGRRIAFTRNREVGDYTTFTDDDVFVMDADGDGVRQLTTHTTGRSTWQPAWSPDGGRIAYVNGDSVATNVPQRWGALFVVDADGANPVRLTRSSTDSSPAWSPDGRELAFARCLRYAASLPRCAHDLFTVDVAGGHARRLTSTERLSETVPAWSPDGERLAFVMLAPIDALELRGKEGVYIMNRDGTGVRRLVGQHYLEDDVRALAWRPDGTTIAFETAPALDCRAISLVDIETEAVRPLTSCQRPIESSVAPSWQPDTRREER